jgi:hypothetical protein
MPAMPKAISTCVLLVLIASISFAQTTVSRPPDQTPATEQRSFSVEDENVRRPVPVLASVLEILRRDPHVQELMTNERSRDLPADWLLASKIHLTGPDEEDLIVIGSGHLLGAKCHAVLDLWGGVVR